MNFISHRAGSIIVNISLLLACSGCTLLVEHEQRTLPLPNQWSESTSVNEAPMIKDSDWWASFGSKELENLITQALTFNSDMVSSVESLRQAEISYNAVNRAMFPNVNANTSFAFSDVTKDVSTISSSAGYSVSYTTDLFGRNTINNENAKISLKNSVYNQIALRLTLSAQVANTYIQLIGVRENIKTGQQTLDVSQKILEIVKLRYQNGVISGLDFRRQQMAVLSASDNLNTLKTQERQVLRSLGLLLGGPGHDVQVIEDNLAGLNVPDVPDTLPSTLLTRRPDLLMAKAAITAQELNIATAKGNLFPLNFTFGISSVTIGSAMGGHGLAFTDPVLSIGASISRAIFDRGTLQGAVDIAISSKVQAWESYKKAVYAALNDVENATGAVYLSRQSEIMQHALYKEAIATLNIAELRYKEGVDDLTTLILAQTSVSTAQLQLSVQKQARLTSAISLYQAIGGGWVAPPMLSKGS